MQAHARLLEDGAGVHQCFVQPQGEEFVAQVVVGGDVAPRAFPRVAVDPVEQFLQRPGQLRETALHAFQDVPVAQHQAHQGDQVVTAPGAAHPGLARPDRATESDVGIEAGVAHRDRGFQVASRPEFNALVTVHQDQPAELQRLHLLQHQPAGQHVQRAWFGGDGQVAS